MSNCMNSNNWNCNDSDSTTYSNTSVSEKLTMLDVCNNELIFIKKADNSITFEYKPMDPIRSCSGSYSGGTPVFKNLKQNEWTKLVTAYETVKTEGKLGKSRYKGTLVLTYESGRTTESLIVEPNQLSQKLTNFFHSYRE